MTAFACHLLIAAGCEQLLTATSTTALAMSAIACTRKVITATVYLKWLT